MSKTGKVHKFDKYVGYIADGKETYMFLDTDLEEPVKVGDLVTFKGEVINDTKRAFFVKKLKTNNTNKNKKEHEN